MKLPNAKLAKIAESKIVDYLLSHTHRLGRHKAALFEKFGFTIEKAYVLEKRLKELVLKNEVVAMEDSIFGTRYVVEGDLATPSGRELCIRSIWFIKRGEKVPYFVTAYAAKRR